MLHGHPLRVKVQIPVHRGQAFRHIADSVPMIAPALTGVARHREAPGTERHIRAVEMSI